jgi:hypothetical protein
MLRYAIAKSLFKGIGRPRPSLVGLANGLGGHTGSNVRGFSMQGPPGDQDKDYIDFMSSHPDGFGKFERKKKPKTANAEPKAATAEPKAPNKTERGIIVDVGQDGIVEDPSP